MNASQPDLLLCRKVAIDAAEEAGQIVCQRFGQAITYTVKGTAGDVVTSLDMVTERLIIDCLHGAFPSHRIVSEESGIACESSSPWTWLVDPLDGSNNIVVGLPVVAIGITLCHKNLPVVGVVHEPFVARTWSAVQGRGAWQADDSQLLRHQGTSRAPVIAWTQGYGVSSKDRFAVAMRSALNEYSRRVLELWAPLCGWAMLARGDIDGIIGYRTGELDLHAGALIARMTGIEIRALDGTSFDARFVGMAETRSLVAASPERIDELLALLARTTLGPVNRVGASDVDLVQR
jgi:myo-inositol-1(or 4)-monophosphatase